MPCTPDVPGSPALPSVPLIPYINKISTFMYGISKSYNYKYLETLLLIVHFAEGITI